MEVSGFSSFKLLICSGCFAFSLGQLLVTPHRSICVAVKAEQCLLVYCILECLKSLKNRVEISGHGSNQHAVEVKATSLER